MRNFPIFLALLLAGCGGDGSSFAPTPQPDQPVPQPVQHAPEISNLTVSPDTVMVMEGDGSVLLTGKFDYSDVGLDILNLRIDISDGTSLTIELTEPIDSVSGTITKEFEVSTNAPGEFTIEIWLDDEAGQSSNHLSAFFQVKEGEPPNGTEWDAQWTNRLTGLPFGLSGVVWDGEYFIAVGDGGTILTSADGLAWAERESGTDVGLNAVAFDGTVIVAVGLDTTVLLSTDHGESWSIKHSGARVSLRGVAVSASQIITGGMDLNTGDVFMMRSLDRGETWAVLGSLPQKDHFVSDLIYANGLFVAATDVFSWYSDTRVLVSPDGKNWQSIVLRDEVAAIYALLHDGERFIAVGGENLVSASVDGFYWTQLKTPAAMANITYGAAAWSGSRLVIHGGITWWYWWFGAPPHQDAGITSIDGGVTWQVFDIDGYYESGGIAWGNGRFVSVGSTSAGSGEGAIYTSP